MKRIFIASMMLLAGFACMPLISRAEMLEINKTANGFVQNAGPNYVSIVEQPSGLENRIGVNSQTQYQGVQKHTDLKKGDEVKIEYNVQDNKKTADVITRDEP